MSEPVLRCESSEVDDVVAAVEALLADQEIRKLSAFDGPAIHLACVEADRRAGLIVPAAMKYLDRYGLSHTAGPMAQRPIRQNVERHVRAELRGSLGLIGTLLLRFVISQVVTWLVEWFFSRYATAYRCATASKG